LLEHAYLQSFVAFYSRLGVECFLIFHDDDLGASLPRLASSVVLLRSNNTGSQRLEDYLHPVQRSGFKWVLAIAVNEFLLLAPRFQGSLQHYIADAQIAAANGIDAFQFSWALTEILEPVCWQLPVSDVLSRKRLQFYSDVHVKTMSRISQVIRFRFHYSPVLRMKPEVCKRHQQGCANGKQRPRRSVHVAGMQFRPSREEGDWIKRGILLSPYVPTDATDARKYADAALVHVQTRSLANMLTEAAATRLSSRKCLLANASSLAELARKAQRDPREIRAEPSLLVTEFVRAVGVKASLALASGSPLQILSHLIPVEDPNEPQLCDPVREREMFEHAFKKLGFDLAQLMGLLRVVAHALALSSERRQRSGVPGAKPWPKQAAASAVIESAWLQGCNAVNAADAKLYPFVHVIGIPKAGTSYLYKLLTSSPYIEPASRHKEYCPSDVKFDKTRYSDGFRLAETMTTRTANGCIDTRQALQLHACVSPFLRFQPKYIMTIRPPDEYQWARYNFWTNQLDARHSPGKWTDGDSYRSPEMFHELVLAGNKTRLFTYASMNLVQGWIDLIEARRRTVGSSNLLLLLSTNLGLPNTRASIAHFLGIRKDFGLPMLARVNSGASLTTRGSDSVIANKAASNVYEVSTFRPMREATRLLIRQRNRGACCVMRYKYSIELDCCDVSL